MPITKLSSFYKETLRKLSRERELMIWPRAAKPLHQSCPLTTSHQISKSAQVQAPHQDQKTILLYPGPVCYFFFSTFESTGKKPCASQCQHLSRKTLDADLIFQRKS